MSATWPGRLPVAESTPSGNQENHHSVQDLTTAQVAEVFGVGKSAVHEWASDDRLPYVRAGGLCRYPAAAVPTPEAL